MRRARFLGELLWKNNLGIYQLAELETQLLQRYAGLFTLPYQSAPRRAYLHVLSKAYDSGGHTRIAEHLLHSELLQDAGVLVSEKAQTLSLNKLQRAKHGCVVLPRMRNSRQKIQRLLEHFAQYTTLLLHIHPHDIETVMAAAMAKKFCGTSVYLYNHADHVFSYGYGVMDKVLEISYFGWDLRAARGTLDKSVYVGIPLKLAAAEKNQAPRTALPEGHIATAGTAYKYRPSLGYSFPEFAQQLVATSKKDLVLIGPRLLLDWWWWRAARQMGQHAHFHPRMPYQQYLDFMAHASLYVDSFPMTGGTAFAEVVSQGLPCFGILTGAHGYSPADQLKSPSQAALLQDILAYLQNPVRPSVDQAAVIQQVRQVHAVEQVALRISRAGLMSKEESAPTWANPAAIRVDFYEKISASAKVFAPTVHCRPDWKLSLLFLRFWIQSRKHSALIKNKINL
ncbi:MAG: hypothetical protein HYZ65_09810 [Burkholderiales bacterium]|nr:hypothetical protein [Burkholderiales bacterium]